MRSHNVELSIELSRVPYGREYAGPFLCAHKRFKGLVTIISTSDGRKLMLRPIRAGDTERLRKLFDKLSNSELRMRFLHALNAIPEKRLTQLTRIECGRQMIFVLEGKGAYEQELSGHVQIISDSQRFPTRTG